MSSDSDNFLPDEENFREEEEIEPIETLNGKTSNKDHLYIMQRGKPTSDPSPFANCTVSDKLPEHIWGEGKLIYDVFDKSACLGPPKDDTDRILRFESHFESGNLGRAYLLKDNTYHLILEYDPNPGLPCQWFYFRMSNVKNDIKYKFYITGFHKEKSLYTTGAKIFWCSEQRARNYSVSWTRGGDDYSYGILPGQKKKFKKKYTVSFSISFPHNNDNVYLCYALPYTYSDLLRDIDEWSQKKKYVQCETLCKTAGGRECPILTVTDSKGDIPMDKRPYIFVTARIHPGESNGSFMMRGYMKFLLSKKADASFIREHYITKIVPMLNIDGVIEGFYRVSLSGDDLNRVWAAPNPVQHPVITQTKELFAKLRKERDVAIYIDFHGHSRLHGTFAFGCPDESADFANKEKIFPRILSYLCDLFSWQHCEFSYPVDRKSAGRIVVRNELNVRHSYTVETSFGGVISGPRAGMLYDQIMWEEIGKKCCKAAVCFLKGEENEYYKLAVEDIAYLFPPKISIPKSKSKTKLTTAVAPQKETSSEKDIGNKFFFANFNDIKEVAPKKIKTTFNNYSPEIH